MLSVVDLKVRTLDVDFHQVSWRIEDTQEDVFDYTFQLLRSESSAGPWEVVSQPFQDQYIFFDRIAHPFHAARLFHYLLRVTNNVTEEQTAFGPVDMQPEADLVATELRRHMNLLFREFTGRRCWILPVRTFGQRCFLPGTVMQGAVVGASRALYKGKAVHLTTKEGHRLSVTANHPVLTAQGLTDAQAVRVGDHLVCYGDHVDGVRLGGTERDEQNKPALAEEVFRSLSEVLVAQSARAVGLDFHGEAQSFVGDVEVVGSYGDLLVHDQSTLSEQSGEGVLAGSSPGEVEGVGLCAEHALSQGLPSSSSSFVRSAGLLPPSFGAQPRVPLVRRFGNPAQVDSPLLECVAETASRNSELPGQLMERGAGLVTLDEVVDVRVEDYFGHVFDFETLTGWVVASNIITSNCSCWNKTLQKRSRSGCQLCYDTGFVRGYMHPIETWVQIDPGSNLAEQNTNVGAMHQVNTTARVSDIGIVKPRDLIIEAENRRWRVTQINQTEQSRAPIHLELTLHQIPPSDVEYSIPLNMEKALKDLYLSPPRNFTNPQNLDAFEAAEFPGIFDLYMGPR